MIKEALDILEQAEPSEQKAAAEYIKVAVEILLSSNIENKPIE